MTLAKKTATIEFDEPILAYCSVLINDWIILISKQQVAIMELKRNNEFILKAFKTQDEIEEEVHQIAAYTSP